MKQDSLLSHSPVATVAADAPISECVKLLRDRNIGALVVTEAKGKENIVGIFTERDLVKNIELIYKGFIWENPIRSIMTSPVHTISPEKLGQAPKIMARYKIRHLPVVTVEKQGTRVVGVVSMRDVFRVVMESLDYDLSQLSGGGHKEKTYDKNKKKLIGVFTSDKALRELVDATMKLTGHLLVKAQPLKASTSAAMLSEYIQKFDALFLDIDEMSESEKTELLGSLKAIKPNNSIYLAFNPVILSDAHKRVLHKLVDLGQIHLLAKPIAVGLFYEKFLKEL